MGTVKFRRVFFAQISSNTPQWTAIMRMFNPAILCLVALPLTVAKLTCNENRDPTYSSWYASTHNQEEHGMDPTTVFCPNRHCPARGQTGRGNIGIHSQKEQRFICHECHKTFSATTGTVFYRLRTAAETVSLVVTLLAHGCP